MKEKGSTAVIVAVVVIIAILIGGAVYFVTRPTEEKITLNVSTIVGINGEITKMLEEDFEAEFPNIDLVITEHPWGEVTEIQLTDMVAGTRRYDVVTTYNSALAPYAEGGQIYPIDEFIEEYEGTEYALTWQLNDMIPALRELMKYEGHYYGLSQNWWVFGLYYRTDIVEEKGLTVPTTFDEIPAFAEALTEEGVYGWSEAGMRGGAGCNTYTWFNYLWSFGGDIFDESYHPVFNSPEGVEALQFYVDMLEYSSPEIMSLGCDQNTSLIQTGKVVAMIQDSDQLGFLEDPTMSEVVGKMAMAPLPTKIASHSMLGYWMISINADTQYKDEAYKYIQFMTRKNNLTKWITKGQAPWARSLLEDSELDAQYPAIPFDVIEASLETAKTVPYISEYTEVEDILSVEISNAMLGQKTPKEALDDAATDIEDLLRAAGYY